MSRSWSKPRGLRASGSIGIAIGRGDIAAACVAAGTNPMSLGWTRALAAPPGWLAALPAPEHPQALSEVLARLAPEARRAFVPVHVALPDALGNIAMLAFDDLPKGEAVRRRLVRWRMAQELGVPEAGLAVAYQDMGAAGEKRMVLCQAVHADWLRLVKDALAQAGLVAWSINQAICFRFNGYYRRLVGERKPGAMLALDADAWTTAIWDAAGRLRFVRARWRAPAAVDAAAELEEIADEFERIVLAYVNGGTNRSVERIYASAAQAERERLADAINPRLQTPCVILAPEVTARASEEIRSADMELAVVAAGAA